MPPRLIVLLCDVRSAYNAGSIMRTADAVGAGVWTAGITPHPHVPDDPRPPHVVDRAEALLRKTALGAQTSFAGHFMAPQAALSQARADGRGIWALEQAPGSVPLFDARPAAPLLLLVGNEPDGLPQALLAACDGILEIPMHGRKESLNVAVATGIALYHLSRATA